MLVQYIYQDDNPPVAVCMEIEPRGPSAEYLLSDLQFVASRQEVVSAKNEEERARQMLDIPAVRLVFGRNPGEFFHMNDDWTLTPHERQE